MDISSRRVETFRRTREYGWLIHEYLPDARDCPFPALEVSMSFEQILKNLVSEQAGFTGEQDQGGSLTNSDVG